MRLARRQKCQRRARASPQHCSYHISERNRHAPFTWGSTVAKAVEVAVAAECCAHMALMSLALDPKLKPIEPELLNKHFKRKHGPGAYYGQK